MERNQKSGYAVYNLKDLDNLSTLITKNFGRFFDLSEIKMS